MEEVSGTDDRKIFTLSDVTKSIQKTIRERYTSAFWLKAELNKLNYYKHSGHCYPDLVEKKEGKIVAQMRSTLWKDDYRAINQKFISITKEPLKEGIKILLLAKISYDPSFGLALRILDIDPSFTLGDLEKEKNECIQYLHDHQLFHQNQQKPLALLPKRLAIISVESSKGYADFKKIIDSNPFGYVFETHLFPSLLQGDGAVAEITNRLQTIRGLKDEFDAVLIIRGGGGDIGLTCYNHIKLCEAIATFPLPVLTGIGHATNLTVAEMVAHFNAITPTKLAEFLIQKFHNFAVPLSKAQEILMGKIPDILSSYNRSLTQYGKTIVSNARLIFANSASQLDQCINKTTRLSNKYLHVEKSKLDNSTWILESKSSQLGKIKWQELKQLGASLHSLSKHSVKIEASKLRNHCALIVNSTLFAKGIEQKNLLFSEKELKINVNRWVQQNRITLEQSTKNVENLSPENVLNRGYSITKIDNNILKSVAFVQKKSTLHTILSDGVIHSSIEKIENHGKENR